MWCEEDTPTTFTNLYQVVATHFRVEDAQRFRQEVEVDKLGTPLARTSSDGCCGATVKPHGLRILVLDTNCEWKNSTRIVRKEKLVQ